MPYVPPHLRGQKNETRHKSVVVLTKGSNFIVVKDAKSGDITFVVGGCKMGENKTNCAFRELKEETRNSVRAKKLNHLFYFNNNKRSKSEQAKNIVEAKKVTMRYNVFKANINKNFKNIHTNFHKSKSLVNAEKEASNIKLMSRNNLVKPGVMWNFMRNKVLKRV